MKVNTTIGVYNDGSFKVNGVSNEDLDSHIEYNKTFRFGRALFVNGKCVHKGYLSEERVKEFEKRILTEGIRAKQISKEYV